MTRQWAVGWMFALTLAAPLVATATEAVMPIPNQSDYPATDHSHAGPEGVSLYPNAVRVEQQVPWGGTQSSSSWVQPPPETADGETFEPPIGADNIGGPNDAATDPFRYSVLDLSTWPARLRHAYDVINCDYSWYYSYQNIQRSLVVFSVGAAFANTGVDEEFRQFWLNRVRGRTSNRLEDWSEPIGRAYFVLAGAGAVWLSETLCGGPDSDYATWGDNCVRALAVGGGPMLLAQWITGGSRPGETGHEAQWRPFEDVNGVSGHAFVGAIPFIAAAQVCTDWRLKALFYVGSTATGLGRINNDAHYLSQVMLGWWMAYVACSSVSMSNASGRGFDVTVAPLIVEDGAGIALQFDR